MTATAPIANPPLHSRAAHVQWIPWLLLLLALSYKIKVLGEAGVRPLYLAGVAFGAAWLIRGAASASRRGSLTWRNPTEVLLIGVLLLFGGYVLMQSLAHPAAFNDTVYAVVTAYLVFGVSVLSLLTWGWEHTAQAVYKAMLHYCLINIVLLALSVASPTATQGILVSPLESGFGTRLSGLPGDPTHLGAALALTLLLMLVLRRAAPIRALLIVALLIITGSRNAILSLLVGCLAALLTEPRIVIHLARAFAGLLVLVAIGVVVALLQADVADFVSAVFRIDDDNAYSRVDIWLDMLGLIGRMPLLELLGGGGYLYIQETYGSPYNAFLRILFGQGLIGLLVFVSVTVVLFLRAALDPVQPRRRLTIGLLAFWLVFSMFLDTAFAEFFHFAEFCFWFAAALVTTQSMALRSRQADAN
jgi:O-antigen ligase